MLKRYKYCDKTNRYTDEYELVSKEQFMTAHVSDFPPEELDKMYDHLLTIEFEPKDKFDPLDTNTIHTMLESFDWFELPE